MCYELWLTGTVFGGRYYQSESGCQRFLVVILPAETSALFVLGVDAEAAHRTAVSILTTHPNLTPIGHRTAVSSLTPYREQQHMPVLANEAHASNILSSMVPDPICLC